MSKEKSNRRSGMYMTKDSIRNFKIRVKVKRINTFINLPPLYDGDVEVDAEAQDSVEEKIISWQEKIFSKRELESYGIRENCLTEQQLRYYERIAESGESLSTGAIFTYINDDEDEISAPIAYASSLHRGMEALRIKTDEKDAADGTNNDDKELIVKNSSHYVDNEYHMMRIMAQLNPDVELCAIRWYPNRRTMMISPDFNRNGKGDDAEGYTITVDTDGRVVYKYTLELASQQEEPIDERVKEMELQNKTSKQRASPVIPSFSIPPRRCAYSLLILDITHATDFPSFGCSLYVRYALDLPSGWTANPLRGCTSSSKGAAWGHTVQLMLLRDLDVTGAEADGALQPKLYFEVVSRDYWDRHRTEGFGMLVLSLGVPGSHTAAIRCSRQKHGYLEALRRHMIGGCDTLDDLAWLSGYPSAEKAGKCLRYGVQTISAGILHIKYSVITQYRRLPTSGISSKDKQGQKQIIAEERYSLIRSVDDVVSAYREARRRLREARGLPEEQIEEESSQNPSQDTDGTSESVRT